MPDFARSQRADAQGAATIVIQHNISGVTWVVSQIAVEDSPSSGTGICKVLRNGRIMTSSSLVPSTASGYPFYALTAQDKLELQFTNLTANAQAIATISYTEAPWGQPNSGNVI